MSVGVHELVTDRPPQPSPDFDPSVHAPVLVAEVLEVFARHLEVDAEGWIVDGTTGSGGHGERLLERFGRLHYLGLDWDPDSLGQAAARLAPFAERVELARSPLSRLDATWSELAEAGRVSGAPLGVLVDLGVCSLHFDRPERGFSLAEDGPLDMRMSPDTQERTAADVVNTYSAERLANVLYLEGGERRSRRLAAAIVEARKRAPFLRTMALANLVERVVPRQGKAHPATKTFQALRREVNQEGAELEQALEAAEVLLPHGGIFCAITFHSGEDGVVKRRLAKGARAGRWELGERQAVAPSSAEVRKNPRARSARLRSAVRVRSGEEESA